MMFSAANADFLNQLRWEKRIIILDFPKGSEETLYGVEQQIGKAKKAIRERDLVFFHLGELGTNGRRYAGKNSEAERTAARQKLKLGDESDSPKMILIGKDGGVKATQTGNFDLQKFFDLIDIMPMRKREMREG